MATVEQVFVGTRAQIFAAAYESVIMRGIAIQSLDRYAGRFSFLVANPLLGAVVDVNVTVEDADDLHAIVKVIAFPHKPGWFESEYGLSTRAARRFLAHLQAAWAKPLRAYAPAGWYPDVTGRFAKRYWDGSVWTPWVWWRDSLGLDHAPRSDGWWTLKPRWNFNLGRNGFFIGRHTMRWLPPPLQVPSTLRGRRQRVSMRARRVVAVASPMTVLFVFAAVLSLASNSGSSSSPPFDLASIPSRPLVTLISPEVTASADGALSATDRIDVTNPLPVGGAAQYRGGTSVRMVGYETEIAPPSSTIAARAFDGGTTLVMVDMEICAGRPGALGVPAAITIRTDDGRALPGDSTTREPRLQGGRLRPNECRRGWVTVPVPSVATPRFVEWGDGDWEAARWQL